MDDSALKFRFFLLAHVALKSLPHPLPIVRMDVAKEDIKVPLRQRRRISKNLVVQ
jgi:hypothetical protein